MDYSERRCRFLGAADAGYDGRCKLQQTSAFRSLLGRPCHLFPLLLASQVGTHYSIWLFEMEYPRWPGARLRAGAIFILSQDLSPDAGLINR